MYKVMLTAEEWVREVLGIRLECRVTSKCAGDLSTTVQDLNGWSIGRLSIWAKLHLSHISPVLEHAKRSTKSQISNNVESGIVEPIKTVYLGVSAMGQVTQLVPLGAQHLEIVVHVLLELANGLGTECVGNGLALACVLNSIPCVEKSSLDRHESIVVVALEEANTMTIDEWYSIRVGDRDMLRRYPDQLSILFMCCIHHQISFSFPGLVHKP